VADFSLLELGVEVGVLRKRKRRVSLRDLPFLRFVSPLELSEPPARSNRLIAPSKRSLGLTSFFPMRSEG
jgi:hypothetical protein